jgi:hypothetical protein
MIGFASSAFALSVWMFTSPRSVLTVVVVYFPAATSPQKEGTVVVNFPPEPGKSASVVQSGGTRTVSEVVALSL